MLRGGEDAVPEDMPFLPLCKHVDKHTDSLRKRNAAFTHLNTLPLPFSHGHNDRHTNGLALILHSLAEDPEAEPGEGETQLLLPALNLQHLPMKRESIQLDSFVDRQHDHESGTPILRCCDAAQMCYCNVY